MMLNIFIVGYGTIATASTLYLGWLLWKFHIEDPFIRAVNIMVFALCVTCLSTLVFGATSLFGVYVFLPPWAMVLLRFIIFTAGLASSALMWREIQKMKVK